MIHIFMTRTFGLIMGVLPPRDIARIVESYMWPTSLSDEAMAEVGYYELCRTISPDHGLRGACRGNHRAIAEMMIEAGANLFYGLIGACDAGHADLAEWILLKGCLVNGSAFWSACTRHHRDVMRLLIKHGVTECFCGQSIEEHKI